MPNLPEKLYQITGGKDILSMVGMSETSVLALISEVGTDLSKWETAKHFVSWLGLSPRQNQSGKGKKRVKVKYTNRAGQIFRLCARAVAKTKNTALRGFYYRIKSKKGGLVANKAVARKLAVLFYNILTKGIDYVEVGLEQYQQQYRERQLLFLKKKALEFGMVLS